MKIGLLLSLAVTFTLLSAFNFSVIESGLLGFCVGALGREIERVLGKSKKRPEYIEDETHKDI